VSAVPPHEAGGRHGPGAGDRIGAAARRIGRAWRALAADQRLAAAAALALVVCMLLPWYEKNVALAVPGRGVQSVTTTLSGIGVFEWVEAAILLVAAGVLLMLFARAENRAFHLPGGDGTVIAAAGVWAAVLLFYRVLDRPHVSGSGATLSIQWGFFAAFVAAGALALAGQRVRSAHHPEPPIEVPEHPRPRPGPDRPPPPGRQLTIEDAPEREQ
jgi:drug/metabolite transporter (DMT)-like permease